MPKVVIRATPLPRPLDCAQSSGRASTLRKTTFLVPVRGMVTHSVLSAAFKTEQTWNVHYSFTQNSISMACVFPFTTALSGNLVGKVATPQEILLLALGASVCQLCATKDSAAM